ncbi:MAG: hypothetical protein QNJ00_05875 [Woeseiaceae bacterium]|nr:hypothetical protein [Woeseiaceae bacterium]
MTFKTRVTTALTATGLVAGLIAGFVPVAGAQTLEMEGTQAARQDDGRPTRGMTQASVESKYGSPVSVQAPVGEPPITRWEYQDFVVFFEYDRVIHSVLKR